MHFDAAEFMRFGIVVPREFSEFADANLTPTIERLIEQGCSPQNIDVKHVPTAHDLLMATQFFAEYTDVDGVILLAPQNRVFGTLSLMNGIVTIQIQWNMVVSIGGVECADNIVEMVTLQNAMEAEAPEIKARPSCS